MYTFIEIEYQRELAKKLEFFEEMRSLDDEILRLDRAIFEERALHARGYESARLRETKKQD